MPDFDPWFPHKALAYPDRCRAILAGEFPSPVQVTVYPTNKCNRNCRWCIMAEERKTGAELPLNVWHKVLHLGDAGEVKCLRVSGGGEPTLYPFLHDAESFRGTRLLDTNGTALTRDICHAFNRVRVSLNAGTLEGYTDVTGCGKAEWLELLFRLRVACRKPRAWEVGTAMVADRQNADDVEAFIRVSQESGADWCHIRPAFHPPGPEAAATVANWPHVVAACRQPYREQHAWAIPVRCTSEKFAGYWEGEAAPCRATPLVAVVCADARLAVCQDVFTKWGDLNTQTFAEAWKSEDHRKALAAVDYAKCPRCVMGTHNQVIEHCFNRNDCMMEVM